MNNKKLGLNSWGKPFGMFILRRFLTAGVANLYLDEVIVAIAIKCCGSIFRKAPATSFFLLFQIAIALFWTVGGG